jgi:hypothetical protein
MSRWYINRERRRLAKLLAAFAIATALVAITRLGVGGQVSPFATLPAHPPASSATPESQPPLLVYNVRFALDQMERQV